MDEYAFTAGEKAVLIAIFLGGLVLLIAAVIWKHRLERYEFENRTDGGVVQFSSYGASVMHGVQRKLMVLAGIIGTLGTAGGLLLVILAFKG